MTSRKKQTLPLREMHRMLSNAAETVQPSLAATFGVASTDYLYQRAQEALAVKQHRLALTLLAFALVRDAETVPVQPDAPAAN